MSDKTVSDLMRKAKSEGVEPGLWYGRLMWARSSKASAALKSEFARHVGEIRALLAQEYAAERARRGASHKWVIRLGDNPSSSRDRCSPAMLACGPVDWYTRLIRQAKEFSQSDAEKRRWVLLEQEDVGAVMRDDRGILVASVVKLPEGLELGGLQGSLAEIVSACEVCVAPPVDDESIKNALAKDSE